MCEPDQKRRKLVAGLGLLPIVGLRPSTSHAFLPLFIRFLIGAGIRSSLARGALGGAGRSAVRSGARSGAARRLLSGTAARRNAAGTAGAAGGMSTADAALLSMDLADLASLSSRSASGIEPLQVAAAHDSVFVDISGTNPHQFDLGGLLSIALFDEAYAETGSGFIERMVIGDVFTPPNSRLRGRQQLSLDRIEQGKPTYVMPYLAHPHSDQVLDLAFEPAVQLVQVS